MSDPPLPPPVRSSGRMFLAGAFVFPVLGILGYAAQIYSQRLSFPWYVPTLSCLGVAFALLSLGRRRTAVRITALVTVALLAAGEIFFLYALTLPGYAGSLAAGKPFPTFETRRADGTPFRQTDLVGAQASAMVFFRGRW